MRRLLVASAVVALSFVPAATAGPILDRTSQSLANDPVYVDPAATPTLTPSEASALASEIADKGDGPIFVAVLPAAAKDEVDGNATDVVRAIHDELARPGVYAVVAGGQFRALATRDSGLAPGEAAKLATAAFDDHHDDGLAATLSNFVDRVGSRSEEHTSELQSL